MRTKRPLPDLLQAGDKEALTRISPSNRLSQKFNVITQEKASGYLNSPFNTKIKAFLHTDNHLYFISSLPVHLSCVSITGVFEDPTALQDYSNCCDCDSETSKCFDYDTIDYPITTELLNLVRTDVIKELIGKEQMPEDKNNNSDDK